MPALFRVTISAAPANSSARAITVDVSGRPYESTVQLIRELRERGVAIGLVSASRNAEEVLAGAGLLDLFDARVDGVVSAERGLPGKPDPALFLEAAEKPRVTTCGVREFGY